MELGWQEIIASTIVIVAIWILVRRVRSGNAGGACGHCDARPAQSHSQTRIQEVYNIHIHTDASHGEPDERSGER